MSFLRDTHADINTTSDNINRECNTGRPCVTLADVNQTLGTVRGTFGQIEIATKSFNRNQAVFFGQEQALYVHSDAVLTDFSSDLKHFSDVLDTTNDVVGGLKPVESSAVDEFGMLKTTTLSLNAYLNSEYFVGTTKNLYNITGNIDGISGDIRIKSHEFFFPAPCVGRVCWLKRTYTVLKDVGPMAEPFYWGVEAFKAINGK